MELLNSSFSQMFCFNPLWLFIPQQGCLEHVSGDAGSDPCMDGLDCLSERREARSLPFLEQGACVVTAQ